MPPHAQTRVMRNLTTSLACRGAESSLTKTYARLMHAGGPAVLGCRCNRTGRTSKLGIPNRDTGHQPFPSPLKSATATESGESPAGDSSAGNRPWEINAEPSSIRRSSSRSSQRALARGGSPRRLWRRRVACKLRGAAEDLLRQELVRANMAMPVNVCPYRNPRRSHHVAFGARPVA